MPEEKHSGGISQGLNTPKSFIGTWQPLYPTEIWILLGTTYINPPVFRTGSVDYVNRV